MLQANRNPRRLVRRPPAYVPNEVLVTAVKRARNDDLPHYISVASGVESEMRSYGDAQIDAVLQRMGYATRSISRVYIPRSTAVRSAAAAADRAVPLASIAADYEEDEDTSGLARTYKITFETAVDVPHLCQELSASRAVQHARPNHILRAFSQPNDTFYGLQWGPSAIGCETGWDIETGHPDVTIGVVDSGVDLDHADLHSKVVPGYDFVDLQGQLPWYFQPLGDFRHRDDSPDDEDGHGTHCAGIAGASANNGLGVAGVCWGGRILPVRVMFRVYDFFEDLETSVGTEADIDAGIKFAIDMGAHVINLSLGGEGPSHEMVLEYAYDKNVCVFAATGNDGWSAPSYPASNTKVLAVGAVEQGLVWASFSNYGPAYNQFVVAPGVEIASTYKDNSYVYLGGTSMATPFATGLGALIVSRALRAGKQLPVNDVYSIIRETATPLGTGKGDPFYGQGLINVPAALEAVSQRLDC